MIEEDRFLSFLKTGQPRVLLHLFYLFLKLKIQPTGIELVSFETNAEMLATVGYYHNLLAALSTPLKIFHFSMNRVLPV